MPEDHEQIVEVLHTAVDHAEFHCSLEFLGDNRLYGVHPQPRGRHIHEHRIHAVFGRWRDHVPESNIHLQWNQCFVQRGCERDADSAIVFVLTDLFGADGVGDERDPIVFDCSRENLTDYCGDRGGRGLSKRQ